MINFSQLPISSCLRTCYIHKCFGVFIVACFATISPVTGQAKVTGVVSTSTGTPLFGATIVVVGSSTTAITIADGSFTINAKPGNTLEISFVGYKSRLVKIAGETSLKIELSESVINLEEVLVTGYSSQKVKEITGSVAIIKPKDLIAIPAGQVEQMLQGRAAGLTVISSGMPGGQSNVRLHGIGNLGDVTPLYIIDGVQGNVNNLNPNDIETLQVLKDAGAYAIYGVRGANGVIIITTKSGRQGKTKITYDFYMGTTRPYENTLDLLNPQEIADLTWIAYKNSGQVGANGNPFHPLYGNGASPVLPDYFIAGPNVGLPTNSPLVDPSLYNIDFANGPLYQIVESNKTGTDWYHETFKPAFSHNHSLTISGASEKNKYLFSVGYLDQQGTFLNTYLKRYTTRINTEFAVGNNFRMGENLQLTYRDNPIVAKYGDPTDNDIFRSIIAHPLLPIYDIKEGWAHFLPDGFFYDNPVAMRVIAKDDKTNYWEIFGNAFAEIDFLRSFTLRTSFGGNLINYNSYNFSAYTYRGLAGGVPDNSLVESSGYRRSWTWTNTAKFSKLYGDAHRVNALIGTEAIDNYNREIGAQKRGLYTDDVNYRFLSNGISAGQSNYSFAGTSTLFSLISQADYGFKDKLFFKATLRRDGSSVFGPEKRYGWFPSVSAAWRITEEKFLLNVKWLTDLKLRASWGKTGFYGNTDPFNQYTLYGGTIGDAYYDITGSGNNPVQGFRAVRIGDPTTGWQEDVVSNIGFESFFWNGKLNITLDWYSKKAKGLLFPITLPDILGGAIPPNVNTGVIQNKGVDVLLGSKGKFSRDWSWDATVTLSRYKNRILKLTDILYYIPPFSQGGPFVRNEVGNAAGTFYGYKIIGLFHDIDEINKAPKQDGAAPGRFRYRDNNNDGKIDDQDRVLFGDPNPDFTLGINLSLFYKNFDFTTFFYGSFGNDVINVPRYTRDFFAVGNFAKSERLLYDSWTPQNTTATTPRIENEITFSNGATVTSYMMENGSYFRNKSVILGYNLPKTFLQKYKLEKLRFYFQALNLFTITKYSGFDPELPGSSAAFGIDFGNYPNNQKQYLFGINMNF
jgi:TonB-linked SusC/RagA family outer membrane protein